MSEENVISNVEDNSPKNEGVVEKVIEIFKNGWNKQVILYGPPGTSKTYSATIIAAKLLAGSDRVDTQNPYDSAQELLKDEYKDNYKIVQFHPSYSYEDFVRGITVKPAKRNNGITYVTESKIFEKFCKQAQSNKEQKYILIIDEINRAPLASVLGELIYGLEYRESSIATPYAINGKQEFSIPDNLYIIGTMSNIDQPMTPSAKGDRSFNLYMNKVSAETIKKERLQILEAGQEDIRKLADVVEAVMKAGQICVIGSEEKIEEAKDMFKNVTTF